MSTKQLATDLKSTPSNKKHDADGNKSGKWTAVGPPIKEPAAKTFTEKGPALFSGIAHFLYVGGTNGGPPVPLPPVPSVVELKAEKTLWLEKGKHYLHDGDEEEDDFGNKLEVSVISGKAYTG